MDYPPKRMAQSPRNAVQTVPWASNDSNHLGLCKDALSQSEMIKLCGCERHCVRRKNSLPFLDVLLPSARTLVLHIAPSFPQLRIPQHTHHSPLPKKQGPR